MGSPPQDLRCLQDSPKGVFTFCNYHLIHRCLVTAESTSEHPRTSAASGPVVVLGGKLLSGGSGPQPWASSRESRDQAPSPAGELGRCLCLPYLYSSEKRLQDDSAELLNPWNSEQLECNRSIYRSKKNQPGETQDGQLHEKGNWGAGVGGWGVHVLLIFAFIYRHL